MQLRSFDKEEKIWDTSFSQNPISEYDAHLFQSIQSIWKDLNLYPQIYEEDFREWFLPTYYNILISN